MTTDSVGSLIISNSVPTIITMMVTSVYNAADTFFVSKLGTSASGAVGVIFSLMALIQACGFTIGMGAGSITSRALGAKNVGKANQICSSALCSAFSVGVLIFLFGFLFREDIVTHLGATPTILPYALDYAHYILLGAPFMITSFAMNNILRFQGKAAFAMAGMISGGILNMVLDPFFIFGLELGISGAAIATLISQVVSFAILLSVFLLRKSTTVFSFRNVSFKIKVYGDIVTTGLPSLCRQGMAAVSTILMNLGAAKYGALAFGLAADAAVAGMAITNKVFMFLLSISLGLGQGFQPVCGINFGAGKTDRVKQAYLFLVKVSSVVMTVLGVAVFVAAPWIVKMFRDDSAVVAVGAVAMRFQACILPLHSVIHGTNMLLQTTGAKKSAIFLSSMRQGIFFIPLIVVLPHVVAAFGAEPILGIQMTQTVSDVLSALSAIPFAVHFFRKWERRT